MADYNCFVDELELQAKDVSRLVFYFFGVMLGANQGHVEDEVRETLQATGSLKFHALKAYKKQTYEAICSKLTTIIIENKAKVVCFPFEKEWLKTETLKELKNFSLPKMETVRYSNYRSMAWLLFMHTFNCFLKERCYGGSAIIIADGDSWLKSGQRIVHEGEKLRYLQSYITAKQGAMPLLALADHAGYLFYRLKQITYENEGKLHLKEYNHNNYVHKNAVALYEGLLANECYYTLDLKYWLGKQEC
jgi:hypothetical protein